MTIISIMNCKKIYTVNAILSLVAGAFIYLFFRPHTIFLSWLLVDAPLARLSFIGDNVVKYYLCDFLWCYALCFSLFRLHLPSTSKAVFIALCAFAFGSVWEIMQYIGWVSGTYDFFDCVAYGAGSISALCIYFLIKRRKL